MIQQQTQGGEMPVGTRVRVLATGELATVTAEMVPYMCLVRIDGDAFEIHLNRHDLERVDV